MKYTIKAHPTRYAGVVFRSRLEARWAAFFDLAGWEWEYEPVDLSRWSPDFKIRTPCYFYKEAVLPGCGGEHAFLCEVKPYAEFSLFADHPMFRHGEKYSKLIKDLCLDGVAAFGLDPSVAVLFSRLNDHDCGFCDVIEIVPECLDMWKVAGNLTQFRPPTVETSF